MLRDAERCGMESLPCAFLYTWLRMAAPSCMAQLRLTSLDLPSFPIVLMARDRSRSALRPEIDVWVYDMPCIDSCTFRVRAQGCVDDIKHEVVLALRQHNIDIKRCDFRLAQAMTRTDGSATRHIPFEVPLQNVAGTLTFQFQSTRS